MGLAWGIFPLPESFLAFTFLLMPTFLATFPSRWHNIMGILLLYKKGHVPGSVAPFERRCLPEHCLPAHVTTQGHC